MTDNDVKEINSAKRLILIMTDNDDVFKNNTRAMSLKAALGADISALEASGAERATGRSSRSDATANKGAAEDALEVFLRKIAADAKTIKRAEPDFENNFKLPEESFSSQILLETARSYMENLTTPVAAKFADFGSNAVTAANIQTMIDAINNAGEQQETGRNKSIGATADTRAAMNSLKENRRLLKDIGENLIESAGDAGLLAEWISAAKIARNEPKKDPPTAPEDPDDEDENN